VLIVVVTKIVGAFSVAVIGQIRLGWLTKMIMIDEDAKDYDDDGDDDDVD